MAPFTIEKLYQDYKEKIYIMAYRLLGNQEDAEDITQETFINAQNHLETFKGNSHILTWLFSISKNLCFRVLEKRSKNSFSQIETLINTASTKLNRDLHTQIEIQSMADQVKQGCLMGLLQCLSINQRSAFILVVILNFQINHASKILDKSSGAIKVLVHRARKNLKAFLCEKCSLYDPQNACQCENLIEFSLSRGWIEKHVSPNSCVAAEKIETKLNDLQKIAILYRGLPKPHMSADLDKKISRHLF